MSDLACDRRKDDAMYLARTPRGCVREGKRAIKQERQWSACDCYCLGYERMLATHETLRAIHNE